MAGPDQTWANIVLSASVTNVSGPIRYTSGIVYNGSIYATATGGTSPYTYSINPAIVQNNGYFPELPVGTYTILATDATGQQTTITVTIVYLNAQPSMSISGIVQPSGCNTADGGFTLTGTGGTPPYRYSIDRGNSFTSNNLFSNLTQGNYEVLIKDANGQVAQLGPNPTSPNSGPNVFLSGPNCGQYLAPLFTASCVNNGSASITLQSYTPIDSFSLDGIHYRQIPESNNVDIYQYDSIGLAPGLYKFYQKVGGVIDIYAGVSELFCYLNITSISIDASCGQNDGGFQVIASNGYPPYSYSIDGTNYQASNSFGGLASGNYSVTVKDITGASYSATATVFNKCPTVTATSTSDFCGQNNGTLMANGQKGTLPYQFSIDGTNFQSGALFNGLAAGNYTVTIKDALGFKSTGDVTVAAYCLSISATPSNASCANHNGTITAAGAGGEPPYTYSTDGINYQSSTLFSDLPGGQYNVTVKDATGNISSTPITIANIHVPTLAGQPTPATCAENDGTISLTATGGTTPYQYTVDNINWQSSNAFSGLGPGNYLLYVKDADGCMASTPVTITITSNLTISPGRPFTICQGDTANIAATSNGAEFSWSPTTGLNNPTVLRPNASPATTTIYTCTANWNSCEQQISVIVSVNPAPIAHAGQDTTICSGQSVTLDGSGGIIFNWIPTTALSNPSAANPIVNSPSQTTTYQLTVADQLGCSSLNPATVTIYVTPPAELSAGNDTSVLTGEPTQLNAVDVNNSGFTTYTWTPSTGLNNPNIRNPVAALQSSTVYTITAQTSAGCEGAAKLTINVYNTIDLIVPSAFTPNGDGRNDILRVIPLGIRQLQYFAIFNPWGQRIFYSTSAASGWDGTINGLTQPSGAYVWMAAGIDVKGTTLTRRGSVILIR